jgi:hypothetical protein
MVDDSGMASYILMLPLAIALYGSGLLLWPLRRWLRRKRSVRGRSLGFVFVGQFVAYAATMTLAAVRPRMLEHFYYWFIFLIELNILFTIAGAIAWTRDSSYERKLDTKSACTNDTQSKAR